MLRQWHLALPVLAQLCWRQHVWVSLWHCEMSRDLQCFVLKLPRVPDCFQLSDSFTWSNCLIFLWLLVLIFSRDLDQTQTGRPTICFSRWCQILLTLSGASTTNRQGLICPRFFALFLAGKELFWSKTEWQKIGGNYPISRKDEYPEAMGLLYMQTSPGKTERVKEFFFLRSILSNS